MRFSWTRVSTIVYTFCVRTSMWLFHMKLKAYVQVSRFVRVISCAMAMQPCSQVWALRSNFCTPPWVPLHQFPNCTALAHLDTHQCKTSMQKSSGLRATATTTLLYTTLHNTTRYLHKPGAQNEHQPNAENKGLIWWYDKDKILYQNQNKKDPVDTVEKMFHVNRKESSCTGVSFSLLGSGCYRFARNWPTYHQHSVGNLSNS